MKLDTLPTIVVDKCHGITSNLEQFISKLQTNGGWFSPMHDTICIFGDMNMSRLLYTLDHEFLHRIVYLTEDRTASAGMDNIYLFDLLGIDQDGEPDPIDWKIGLDRSFDWRY